MWCRHWSLMIVFLEGDNMIANEVECSRSTEERG
jgi:hypothetical protein